MTHLIEEIEEILFEKASKMESICLQGDLGAIIFEATLYNYSKQIAYKEKAKTLIQKTIEVFGKSDFGDGFIEGFEGIYWTINYAYKCGIIDSDEILIDIEPYLYNSLKRDIDENNFSLFYGSIGKLLFYLESNLFLNRKEELIQDFISSLYTNRVEIDGNIFWKDIEAEKENVVNLGIAHGLPAVLIVLLKLKEDNCKHKYLDTLIHGLIKSLSSFENKQICASNFPTFHSLNKETLRQDSRLAWCTGDFGIAYAFLYASDVLKSNDLQKKAYQYMEKIAIRGLSYSGIDHFERYSFYDTAFCHGLSGILYMFLKVNEKIKDPILEKRIFFWKEELIKNLKIQLNIKEDIYLPWNIQDEKQSYILDKQSFLNGLCGAGLVLLSLEYKKYDWSNLLLLY